MIAMKNFILLCFLIFFSAESIAQDWQTNFDSGIYYLNNKAYAPAIEYLQKSQNIANHSPGISDSSYYNILIQLSNAYLKTGRFSKAEPLLIEALPIFEKLYGTKNEYYLMFLKNLADGYCSYGPYYKGDPLYIKVLELQENTVGKLNFEYTNTLYHYGILHLNMGNYPKAESLFVETLKLQLTTFGEQNKDYAVTLNALAGTYYDIGDFSKAELLYSEVIGIRKNILSKYDPDYAVSLNNLATVYISQGYYSKAEKLYLEALELQKAINSDQNQDYALTLSNLAILYSYTGELSKEESFLLESIKIQKSLNGIMKNNYANSLNKLGRLYCVLGNYRKAKIYDEEAISIIRSIYGSKHPNYALQLHNLGVLNLTIGEFHLADSLFKCALEIQEINKMDNNYFVTICDLADLTEQTGDIQKSSQYYLAANEFVSSDIKNNYLFYTRKQSIENILSKSFYFNSFYSFVFRHPIENLYEQCYNNELLLKLINLRISQAINNTTIFNKDPQLANTYSELKKIKMQLCYSNLGYLNLNTYEFEKLLKDEEDMERTLLNNNKIFSDSKKLLNYNINDIKNKISQNQAASVDFISFKYFNRKGTDRVIYAALVLRSGYRYPKFIYLCENKDLDSLLDLGSQLSDSILSNKIYSSTDKSLYNLIWNPIDSLLNGVKDVFISPSGKLNSVSLSAIYFKDSMTLGEKYNMHILGTEADIVNYKPYYVNSKNTKQAITYGGIDYDNANQTPLNNVAVENSIGFPQVAEIASRSAIVKFGYLPGTLDELKNIQRLCGSNDLSTISFTGEKATEASFKQLSSKKEPFILHIATHGYFFPDPQQTKQEKSLQNFSNEKKNVFKWSDDPLLRSGLIFAGANNTWGKTDYISDSTEDGILTSYEISNLDLSNCQLVVLSACETGLGDIKGSEGVFGLQRAFKMAGVKNIIMSLWKVPDKETQELMTLFYNYCFSGKSVHDALQSAQSDMKKKYPPYYWAAFKLLE
jgi:CHAT domain-containing protein/Tfp pilus assembly protein PilF